MESGPKKLIIIGIILLIVGIVGGVVSLVASITDPSEEADWSGEVSSTPKTIRLDSGEYDVWYEGTGGWFTSDPGVVQIRDSSNKVVFNKDAASSSESVTVNGRSYQNIGSLDIDKTGDYTIECDNACTMYITPPSSFMLGVGLCIVGVIMGLVGGILMLIGVVKHFGSKKKSQYPPPSYPGQQPYGYLPPPQYPPSQYPPPQYPPPQQPPPGYGPPPGYDPYQRPPGY